MQNNIVRRMVTFSVLSISVVLFCVTKPFSTFSDTFFCSVSVSRCELCLSVLCGGCQRCAESIRAARDHYGGSAETESSTHSRSPPHSCLPPARAALPASLPAGETHEAESIRTLNLLLFNLMHVPEN